MKIAYRGALLFTGLILLWQLLIVTFDLPPYILPSPLLVIHALLDNTTLLANEAIITITETLLGLILGIVIGSLAAICMAYYGRLSYWMLPLLIISQALPTFAIAPLLVIWFGFGMTSKIITTLLMIFFPITSSFYDGLRRTDNGWIDLATTMNAKKWRIFTYIRIPAALPSLASGIRVATVAAPIGAIVGEWVGASKGLGFLMLNANARMQIDLMFAALFILILFSLTLYYVINRGLLSFINWEK